MVQLHYTGQLLLIKLEYYNIFYGNKLYLYLTSLWHKIRHGADRTLLDNQGMSALDHAQQVVTSLQV